MLDEQQDTSPAALSEADIRSIVRSELERAGQQGTGTQKAHSSPRRERSTGPTRP